MRPRRLRIIVPIALAATCGAGVSSATATDVQFQPDPCVITLDPVYQADVNNAIAATIPDSAVQCPGFAFDSSTMTMLAPAFQDANGAVGPVLQVATIRRYDPALNAVVEKNALKLNPSYQGTDVLDGVTYSSIYPSLSIGQFWLDDPGDPTKHYRLTLARPFTIVRATVPPPSCTLTLASQYAYHWNQENYFVVPPSAVSCEGFTYDPNADDLYMSFSSRIIGSGAISPVRRRVYNRSTGTYSTTFELRLSSYGGSRGQFIAEREQGLQAPAGAGGWTWGRFNQDVDGATVSPYSNPAPQSGAPKPTYRLTLANSFAIKRATDVTASATRVAIGLLRVKIHADRNWSFQNTVAPTYRRQTVVPGARADHAQLKRDGKLIRRVTLSNYGNATVTIPASGLHRYTVTMVETNENFAGGAAFTK